MQDNSNKKVDIKNVLNNVLSNEDILASTISKKHETTRITVINDKIQEARVGFINCLCEEAALAVMRAVFILDKDNVFEIDFENIDNQLREVIRMKYVHQIRREIFVKMKNAAKNTKLNDIIQEFVGDITKEYFAERVPMDMDFLGRQIEVLNDQVAKKEDAKEEKSS